MPNHAPPKNDRTGPAGAPADPATNANAYAGLIAWREGYAAALGAPDGWWSVTGLSWLDGGAGFIGSHQDALVRLPDRFAPEIVRLAVDPDGLRVEPVVGSGQASPLDLDGVRLSAPIVLQPGRSRLTVGASGAALVDLFFRGGRWGARSFDPAQGAKRASEGVAWFDPAPGWCVPARVEEPSAGETVAFTDVLGEAHVAPVAGRVRFVLGGQEHVLIATSAGEDLFVNFRDETNGAVDPSIRTYGAGRFLKIPAPTASGTVIDFHRAYHPPCAHTPYAMCPLPPAENRLRIAVLAGERLPLARG